MAPISTDTGAQTPCYWRFDAFVGKRIDQCWLARDECSEVHSDPSPPGALLGRGSNLWWRVACDRAATCEQNALSL